MRIRVYRDNASEWRWQAVAGNGQILGDSGEGYKNKADCVEMARKLNPGIDFIVTDDR